MTKKPVIKVRDKFVLALTVKNLIEDGWTFEENEKAHLVVLSPEKNLQKIFTNEKAFQDWINDEALNF